MSVVSLLELPEVCEQLDRIIPTFPPRISASLVAPPVTRAYALVGTAFDYAARFELQRRYPHVRTKDWVAENALDRLSNYTDDKRVLKGAKNLVTTARRDCEAYVLTKNPSAEARATMAAHSIRLAKLDSVFRAGFVDPNMETADPGDVQDILRLLDVAPYEQLSHATTLWLNPIFDRYSGIVGGADCDLVSGDRLIDIKVTKSEAIQQKYVRQIVSYAILGRGARADSPEWPEIRHVGIYFARHAHLWTIPVENIFNHPDYAMVEKWYFQRAAEEFGTHALVGAKMIRNGWPIMPGMTADEIAFLEDDSDIAPRKPSAKVRAKAKPKKAQKF
jgi:hypothetical protein